MTNIAYRILDLRRIILTHDTNPPRVAIGLPVFNGEEWLQNSIESILDQTFTDIELLISDNASMDGTSAICEKYCSKDNRVRYIRNSENVGIFRNFDLAFLRTNSMYFKWCAVGDKCENTFIEKAVEILDRQSDVALVHSKAAALGETSIDPYSMSAELNLTEDSPAVRYRRYLTHVRLNNVMFGLIRSDVLRQTALNRVFHASDVCMMAELTLRGKFVEIPEVLFFRRMDADTSTILKNPEDTLQFFSKEPKSPTSLWHWKVSLALVSRLVNSPVSLWQKLDLLRFLGKRMLWERDILIDELKICLRNSLNSKR